MRLVRFVLAPFGYLLFVLALMALSASSHLLGPEHELGYFTDRLATMLWRYPEVTRRGVQAAWVVWGALFAVALTPIDPLATRWDEVALLAIALSVLWHRRFSARRAEH